MSDDSPWMPPGSRLAPEPGSTPSLPSPPPAAPSSTPPSSTPPPPPPGAVVYPEDGAGYDPARTSVMSSDPSSPEQPPRSRRSTWFVGAAVAATVAVGAAGVFAVANLTGGTAGGSDTPEQLGLDLMAAVENEDVLGVIDVLAPGERAVFGEPLVDLVAELTRLEVLSTDADLSKLLGVDVELDGEVSSATSTNVPDIVNVDMRADAVITFDGAEVPVGELITDNLPDDMLTEMRGTRLTETEQFDLRLTAIEQDERWYFSLLHTVAEFARAEEAPGSLIPIEGIGADGADTPDAAFDGLLDTVEALDLTGMMRRLNPGEAAALQRYAPLFLDDAEAALAEVPLRWEITRREFRVEESGDRATVFVDAIGVAGDAEGESFSVEIDGDCVRAEFAGESIDQCGRGDVDEVLAEFDDMPAIRQFLDTVTDAFADMGDVGIELRRTDDRWYVSPTTTVTEAGLAVLRALDRAEVDAIVEQAPDAAEEFFELVFGGFALDDFGTFVDDPMAASDDVFTEQPAFDETFDESESFDESAAVGDECYGETDPATAADCFDAAVATGEFPETAVPVALRFPECGYQVSWGSEFYALADDEFIAAAEAARPCFFDLLERGVVDEWELPTEILHLECFEGRNWYNVFDDPEYDERYYECLDAAG